MGILAEDVLRHTLPHPGTLTLPFAKAMMIATKRQEVAARVVSVKTAATGLVRLDGSRTGS